MEVFLKTEQRTSHIAVSRFGQWVRRAEGYRGTRHLQPSRQSPVKLHRPPSLPLISRDYSAYSSFSVFRETPMAFFCAYFKDRVAVGKSHRETKWPKRTTAARNGVVCARRCPCSGARPGPPRPLHLKRRSPRTGRDSRCYGCDPRTGGTSHRGDVGCRPPCGAAHRFRNDWGRFDSGRSGHALDHGEERS